MHCPSCGNESSLDQKFCRKCGFSLTPVGELMRAGEPSGDAAKLDRAEREALIVRHMFRWIAWGIIVLGIGVLMMVVNKSFDFGKLIVLASSLLMLGGMGMATYGVISAITKGGAATLKATSEKKDELRAATTKELDDRGFPIPISSITERTTQLIGAATDEAD